MVKHRLNGSLKWIVALATLVGIVFLVSDRIKMWMTDEIATDLKANTAEDQHMHASLDAQVRVTEKVIIGIEKDISQTQKDVGQIVKGQETMNKKLDELFMLQISGPGSGGPPR